MTTTAPGAARAAEGRPTVASWLADGGWFPLATWAVWRLGHLVAVLASGGDPVRATFAFDGAWIRSVVDDGYVLSDPTYTTQLNVAFLPGTPALGRAFATVLGAEAAGMLVANVAGLAAFCGVFAAVRAVSDVAVARSSVVALALWPGSLALWAFMSEGAFIATSALAVLADTRQRRVLAAVASWAAGTFRVVGFTVGPALAVAHVIRTRRIDRVAWGYTLSGVAGLATVMAVQHLAVGDGLAFSRAQEAWSREVAVPGAAVPGAVELVVTDLPHLRLELLMNLISIGVAGVALVLATARFGLRGREGGALVVAWLAFLVPTASPLVSSQVRYVMGAWGALLVLGAVRIRSRWLRLSAALLGLAGSVVLVHRWVEGEFVA